MPKTKTKTKPKPKPKTRKRLTPSDREKEIIEEAVQFFAEVGFEGKTRDLAKDYCLKFLPNNKNCLIVDTTKF